MFKFGDQNPPFFKKNIAQSRKKSASHVDIYIILPKPEKVNRKC